MPIDAKGATLADLSDVEEWSFFSSTSFPFSLSVSLRRFLTPALPLCFGVVECARFMALGSVFSSAVLSWEKSWPIPRPLRRLERAEQ